MEAKVLDHGYIKYIEHWGSDERIIEAARMSTDKGFLGWEPEFCCNNCNHHWKTTELNQCPACGMSYITKVHPGDNKLLSYLYTEKPQHSTPFEMAGIVVEAQAPIMVYREWHRHRTQSYSEMSARYTPLPDLNYIPSVERLMVNSKTNKQAGVAKGADELTESNAVLFQDCLRKMYAEQQRLYEDALKYGVPKELARVHLPVGRYSRMRASANLLNWLRFLTLRMHQKAQWEIRQYANELAKMVEQLFPRTYKLFDEGRSDA